MSSESQPLLEENERPDIERVEFKSLLNECGTILKMALPIQVSYFLTFSLVGAQVFSVGHLGTTALAACALATMWCNVTGYIVGQGMASAMDTLCSIAHTGSSDPHALGKILQRSLVIMTCLSIPVSVLWWFTEPVLLYLQQEPQVASLASVFGRWLIPGLLPFLFADCIKRYLQSQGIMNASMYITMIAAPINVFLQWFLVWSPYSLGIIGAPIATNITNLIIVILLILYVRYVDGGQAWGGWEWSAALDSKGIREFLFLGLAGMIQICSEWWAFEIVSLAIGLIGEVQLAAQSIILNTCYLFFTVPFGLSVATSTRVGNHLGAKKPQKSKNSAHASLWCALLLGLTNASIVLGVKDRWGFLFTEDVQVVQLVGQVLPLAAFFQLNDALGAAGQAVLRGSSRQKYGAVMNIVSYYVLALPIGLTLTFHYELGLYGIWIGLTIGLMSTSLVAALIVIYSDWNALITQLC
ncbi:mate-domain-containing protein [Gorgonomyces haynaldii]|nr:mate-domain-containing protein [Gorgonomyces haynaldii]